MPRQNRDPSARLCQRVNVNGKTTNNGRAASRPTRAAALGNFYNDIRTGHRPLPQPQTQSGQNKGTVSWPTGYNNYNNNCDCCCCCCHEADNGVGWGSQWIRIRHGRQSRLASSANAMNCAQSAHVEREQRIKTTLDYREILII